MQIAINIVVSCSIILLASYSFSLIYQVVKFFNIAHAISISLGAYFTFYFFKELQLTFWLAVTFSIICTTLFGVFLELSIYRPMRKNGAAPFVLLISSLGIYVICLNIISLLWNDDIRSFRTSDISIGHKILGAYITSSQIVTVCISLLTFISVVIFINKTNIGRKIMAVSDNKTLSNILGINSDIIILWTFVIGSILASISGILIAADIDMTPTMGFKILLYGLAAMIIGGVSSRWGLLGGSLLLATTQNLSAYYIDSNWMDATAFIFLIIFLIWKPLGFSGKRLKKAEI